MKYSSILPDKLTWYIGQKSAGCRGGRTSGVCVCACSVHVCVCVCVCSVCVCSVCCACVLCVCVCVKRQNVIVWCGLGT